MVGIRAARRGPVLSRLHRLRLVHFPLNIVPLRIGRLLHRVLVERGNAAVLVQFIVITVLHGLYVFHF